MESPHKGLPSLPKHVRQKIYSYAVDFKGVTKLMRDRSLTSTALTTPTMLLLNRQISVEVVSYIRQVSLEITPDPSEDYVFLSDYVSLKTIRHIKHVRLNIQRSAHLGNFLASDLVEGWIGGVNRQSVCPALESFELNYHEPGLRRTLLGKNERYPPAEVAAAMLRFAKARSITKVKITGTLPRCFTDAIK